jgi:short-subunit dehydrogenase
MRNAYWARLDWLRQSAAVIFSARFAASANRFASSSHANRWAQNRASVLPFLRNSNRPRIINVSSVAGRVYVPFFAPYYSSKHALECISDILRMELRDQDIEVVVVEPGAVRTGFANHENEMLERYASQSELYRKSIGRVVARHKAIVEEGVQPEAIVETVQEAVRADKPKTRYVVPKLPPLAFIALAKLLPSRMTDELLRRIVNL